MKIRHSIIGLVLATTAFGQYAAIPSSSYPALDAILNAKPAFTSGSGAPAGSCTSAKDLYLDTVAGSLSFCSATNTWAKTSIVSGTLTSTALLTGGGTAVVQAPSATATLDTSGNISTPGGITTGAGGSVAGYHQFGQGTAATPGANSVLLQAPTAVTAAYSMAFPGTAASGFLLNLTTGTTGALSFISYTGTSNVVRSLGATIVSPTMVTPVLGDATATTVNKVTITQPASGSTLTVLNGKTLTANNTLTLAGTDSTTMTFPTTSANITQTIASGTSALGTSSIATQACATVVTTSATGTATTDAITWGPNASIKAVTGYAPLTAGGLTITAYPTANNVNFDVCNWSAGSITPGAVTLNWRVMR